MGELQGATLLQVLAGATVAAIVGFFPVRIPGAKISIAGGEIFIFLVMLVYGAPAAVLAAAVEGAVASWRSSKRWTSRIGTPAMASIAMLTCASVFEAARSLIIARGFNGGAIIAAVMAFAVLYWVANTLLTSTLIALKRGLPFTPRKWLKDMSWVGLAYAAGASISGVLFIGFEQFGLPALMIAVPLIAMFLSTLHYYFERKEDDQRHMELLKESESRFHSAFSHAAIGMALVTIEGKFIQANKAFSDMLGRSPAEMLAAKLVELVNTEDIEALQGPVDKLVKNELTTVHTEIRGKHRDGSDVWMSINVSLARDWQFRTHNLIVQAQDVSARRRAEAELYHNAYHDNLTQLSNRVHFDEQLNRAIARVQRHPDKRFAVMYLDFDRFKVVNDSLGHKAGDELLVSVARRLKTMLRETDVLARLGGDEFAILVEDLEPPARRRRARRAHPQGAREAGPPGPRWKSRSARASASRSAATTTTAPTTSSATPTSPCTRRSPRARRSTRCSIRASTRTCRRSCSSRPSFARRSARARSRSTTSRSARSKTRS